MKFKFRVTSQKNRPLDLNPNLDCSCWQQIVGNKWLATNGNPFGAESIGNMYLQSKFGSI